MDISTTPGDNYNILGATGDHVIVDRGIVESSFGAADSLIPGCVLMWASDARYLTPWDGGFRGSIPVAVLLESIVCSSTAVPKRVLMKGSVKNLQVHIALGRVMGIVEDEDGDPVAGLIVGAYTDNGGGTLYAYVTTGADGSYSLTLPPGTYGLLVDVESLPRTYYPNTTNDVVITDHGVTEVDVEMVFMVGGIGGTCSDDDTPANLLEGVSVIVYSTNPADPEYGPELSNASGVYAFTGIRIGTWNVKATKAGHDDEIVADVDVTTDTTTALNIVLDVTT